MTLSHIIIFYRITVQKNPSLVLLHVGFLRAEDVQIILYFPNLPNDLNACIIGKKVSYVTLKGFSIKYLVRFYFWLLLTFKVNLDTIGGEPHYESSLFYL